uniref:Uncharacterized protein n=1 Tax=Gadus morhua TaxID=8049 RepID=A0A8C5AUC8_GADMO
MNLQPPSSADPASSSGSLSSPPALPAQGMGGGMLPESCQYCCQQFRRGNTRVRLLPKRRMAARVHSVLRREARGKRLSLAQCQLLGRAAGMVTCNTCHKTTRHNGVNRRFLFNHAKHTPHGPQTHRSNTGSPKSTFSTRNNTPSPHNHPFRFKKWVVKGLTHILNRDNKPETGTLKDFLSSL